MTRHLGLQLNRSHFRELKGLSKLRNWFCFSHPMSSIFRHFTEALSIQLWNGLGACLRESQLAQDQLFRGKESHSPLLEPGKQVSRGKSREAALYPQDLWLGQELLGARSSRSTIYLMISTIS